jgi:hypothetical protein
MGNIIGVRASTCDRHINDKLTVWSPTTLSEITKNHTYFANGGGKVQKGRMPS